MSGRPWRVELAIRVRPYDVDFSGCVGNVTFLRWLEDLRAELGEAHFPLRRMLAEGLVPTVVRTEIAYRRPVRLGEAVLGTMWVSALGAARWTVAAEIRSGRVLAAEASQECCFLTPGGQVARVPGWVATSCRPVRRIES